MLIKDGIRKMHLSVFHESYWVLELHSAAFWGCLQNAAYKCSMLLIVLLLSTQRRPLSGPRFLLSFLAFSRWGFKFQTFWFCKERNDAPCKLVYINIFNSKGNITWTDTDGRCLFINSICAFYVFINLTCRSSEICYAVNISLYLSTCCCRYYFEV